MSLCQCGCGALAPIAKVTNTKRGWIKGQALRYICGHAYYGLKPRKKSPNSGFPYICKQCGRECRAPNKVRTFLYCSDECRRKARGTPLENFWKKVDKNGPVPQHCPELGPCWIWTGAHFRSGHGAIGTETERRAHRVSWIMHFGPIPEGLHVCHKCDNPPCIRPDHLFLGTQTDNMRDCAAKHRTGAQVHPERIQRGQDRPAAKLNEEKVRIIRELAAAGTVKRELARRFNVTPQLINYVVSRKGWRHVV